MFNRAVTFVRSNIPDSVAEKAKPYVDQAQGYATTYIDRAQSMGTKIHDYAVNKSTSLKETSTTYVNSTAERLDSVLIDQGANKLSTRFLGREVVHFHFKEALEKLQKKNDNNKDNKEQQEAKSEGDAAAATFTKEDKKQAANSIANLFTTITTQVSAKVTEAKESIKARKESVTSRVPKSYDETRQLAVTAVAGAFAFALKSSQYVLVTGSKYVPEKVANRAVSLNDSAVTIATPYLETANTHAKNLDSKFLNGFTYKFVGDVSKELSPAPAPAAQQEQEQDNKKSFKEVVQEIVEEEQEQIVAEQEKQEEQQNDDNDGDVVA